MSHTSSNSPSVVTGDDWADVAAAATVQLLLLQLYGLLIYFPKLINAYKLSCAVYTVMSARGSYTFPHMLPEVTPERCTFYNGAEAG